MGIGFKGQAFGPKCQAFKPESHAFKSKCQAFKPKCLTFGFKSQAFERETLACKSVFGPIIGENMEIQTQIQAVTVYSDRALITRNGKIALENGVQEILVVGLPTLETESLRASGRGDVLVKIIGVEARERPLLKANSQNAREVQAELDAAQDAGKAFFDAMERLDERAKTVKELSRKGAARFAESLAQNASDFQKATQLLDFSASELAQIDAERAALEIQKRENAALQLALSSRLKQLQSGRKTMENVVAVLIDAQNGEWELEISYIVRGARWTPLYDARVSTQNGAEKFVLSLNALVTQKSGENWENVALKLSTARPGLGTLPPKLEPIWIDVPRMLYGVASRKMEGKAKFKSSSEDDVESMLGALESVASGAPEPIEAQEIVAEVSSEGATVEFGLPHRLSVPGDGQNHRVAIATREFPAQWDFLAIPRRVEIAYLRASVKNNSSLSLLEGEVSIFRDGVFVGKSLLKNTALNQEFQLFLGPDEQVRAKRELTLRETDKNFIGSAKRVHFAYEIQLENLKSHAVKIAVQDQIPVSRSENIKVKLRGATPEAVQSDLGVLDWTIALNPGEKRAIRFDYGVESPRDTAIVGLTD